MGIDKLNLTIYEAPDIQYLEWSGDVKKDEYRMKHYQYFCKLDKAEVMWKPHKYSAETNLNFPYCKIDINPKYFDNFVDLYNYMMRIFGEDKTIELSKFRVTRIDLASDIEGLSFDTAISRLYVLGYRRDGLSIIAGSTMYLGSNPLIRVYDKLKEIKYRVKKGHLITEYEKNILEAKKTVTRFEIAIQPKQMTLEDVVNDPCGLASYFDKCRFYNFEDDEKISSLGGLQFLMSQMRREKRAAFEKYKDNQLASLIKENYIASVTDWFCGVKSSYFKEMPF